MDKDDISIYNGILLNHRKERKNAIEKKEIIPIVATWIDLEIITPSKSEKDKYHMIFFICKI